MVDSPVRSKPAPGRKCGGARGAETETVTGAEAGAAPLPRGYALDASDPDLLFLVRADGTKAAAFSATGATAEGVLEAAEEDARAGRGTPPAGNGRRPCPAAQ